MGEPTVLFVASIQHPSLGALFDHLVRRGRRRCAYMALEALPGRPSWSMLLGADGWDDGALAVRDGEPVRFEDLVSVCMDGYYVQTDHLELEPRDREYVAIETWAALVALFDRLSRRCLVANHLVRRDVLNSRLGELSWLASHGLAVPRALVTSDRDDFERFRAELGGRVLYRPVAGRELPMRAVGEEDLGRLESLPLCPVHFEEMPEGEPTTCLLIGEEITVLPTPEGVPPDLVEHARAACRDLGLKLGEVTLRRSPRGWLATGLRAFLSRDVLENPPVLERVSQYLEAGA